MCRARAAATRAASCLSAIPAGPAQRSTATCAPGWRQKPGECPRACVHARARSAAAADVEMKLCQAGADEMLRDNARSRAVGSAWRRSAPSHRRLEERRRQASGACAPSRLTGRRPAHRPHRDIVCATYCGLAGCSAVVRGLARVQCCCGRRRGQRCRGSAVAKGTASRRMALIHRVARMGGAHG